MDVCRLINGGEGGCGIPRPFPKYSVLVEGYKVSIHRKPLGGRFFAAAEMCSEFGTTIIVSAFQAARGKNSSPLFPITSWDETNGAVEIPEDNGYWEPDRYYSGGNFIIMWTTKSSPPNLYFRT